MSYVISSEVDRLSWEREGLWSAYPEDHTGRNTGTAYRESRGHNQQYGEIPSWPWSEDEKDFTLFSRNDLLNVEPETSMGPKKTYIMHQPCLQVQKKEFKRYQMEKIMYVSKLFQLKKI